MTNKDIIKQYVDIGRKIPEYQFDKLSIGLLKTYLRKRMIAAKLSGENENMEIDDTFIDSYEYLKLSKEEKDSMIPYLYFDDYQKLDKNNLIEVVNKILDWLLEIKYLPYYIAPDFEENQIYNLFEELLNATYMKKIDNVPIIKKMMKVIDSKLPNDDAYKEYDMYFRHVPHDQTKEIVDYYLDRRAYKMDDYDFEELKKCRNGDLYGSDMG